MYVAVIILEKIPRLRSTVYYRTKNSTKDTFLEVHRKERRF